MKAALLGFVAWVFSCKMTKAEDASDSIWMWSRLHKWLGVWLCLFMVTGCTKTTTTDPDGLTELKGSLAGFRRESQQNAAELRQELKEQTDSLRAIRSAVETPVEAEGDSLPESAGPQEDFEPPAVSPGFYVVKWTAKWCGPCQAWTANEQAKVEAEGLEVVVIDVDEQPKLARKYGITTVPRFQICRRSDKTAVGPIMVGYRTAEDIIKKVQQLEPAPEEAEWM